MVVDLINFALVQILQVTTDIRGWLSYSNNKLFIALDLAQMQ